ncbi:MAG: DUF4391 domain-containing protein [Candidatus Stygibacter australis]|nr:DUF4391 domain-containing protein [Candidatus Stygibacter australis]
MKQKIKNAIQSFNSSEFYQSSINFFDALGYNSDKRSKLARPDFDHFIRHFNLDKENINKEKALVSNWKEIQFLYQMTNNEIGNSEQLSMFHSSEVDISKIYLRSYLFVSMSLTGNNYSKTDLVNITRQINKQFLQPVLILFSYNDLLCLSVIDRRINKKDSDKDVLEKVTLIKDISIKLPHRAHIEILHDMALPNLEAENFDQLHKEFRRVLDTEELNKKFYKKLSNWYFWALTKIEFPKLENYTQENSNSIGLIRLITRFIFIWFMKERQLIPDKFFKKNIIDSILNFIDVNDSTYYKAIMQNLFFATLNQEMDNREFRKPNQNFNITNLYRYENYFKMDSNEILKLFSQIPFLNGGLFECLDKPHPTEKGKQGGAKIVRIDGFSDRDDNQIKVQDNLFFQKEKSYPDLNDFYGTKNKKYEVIGLIELLSSYKFTIEENTPVDQEIALDPELLGRVFENLLASYNPETQTTARKSTGSYYTPRTIVEYMVTESLKQAISQRVSDSPKLPDVTVEDVKIGLDILFAYTEKEHLFNDAEIEEIIRAVAGLKILDPACGSGAYPMGILQKLVSILNKLDPENNIWKKLQKEKAIEETKDAYEQGDKEERHSRLLDIEEAFDQNTEDYGRKLYLIENCIFGVDIQPIAVQISKLRFFISLLVDEKIDKSKPNWNIRPLPNLEIKFVAANTLIGIEQSNDLYDSFHYENIQKLEVKLKSIRHKMFSAKTPKTKDKYRKQDKEFREKIAQELKKYAQTKNHEKIGYFLEELKRIQIELEEIRKNPLGKEFIEETDFFGNIEITEIDVNKKKNKVLNTRKKYLENEIVLLDSDNQVNLINDTADKLAHWDPYNQNISSNFFDKEWMYGLNDGFDIIIANPPYVRADNPLIADLRDKILKSKSYETLWEKWDIYVAFIEKGYKLLNTEGVLVYIIPDAYMTSKYSIKSHDYFLENSKINTIDFLSDIKVFDAAVKNIIVNYQKIEEPENIPLRKKHLNEFGNVEILETGKQIDWKHDIFKEEKSRTISFNNCISWGEILYVSVGMVLNAHENIAKGEFEKDDLISETKNSTNNKEYVEAKNINKYKIDKIRFLEWDTDRVPKKIRRKTFPELYIHPKIMLGGMTGAISDEEGLLCNHSIFVSVLWNDLQNVNNRSIQMSIKKDFKVRDEKTKRKELEDNSKQFLLKYLLAILNSKFGYWCLSQVRRSQIGFYPDDLKRLPIKKAAQNIQSKFTSIVDDVIAEKKANKNTKILEDHIGLMVYKLYELNYYDIKNIDPEFDNVLAQFRLGREDYEQMNLEEISQLQEKL